MREFLNITGQAVVIAIIAIALGTGLAAIATASETGRTILLNVATGIAIWWIITALQEMRDQGQTCAVCQRLNRTRCPVCNTPHQQNT